MLGANARRAPAPFRGWEGVQEIDPVPESHLVSPDQEWRRFEFHLGWRRKAQTDFLVARGTEKKPCPRHQNHSGRRGPAPWSLDGEVLVRMEHERQLHRILPGR